MITSSKAPSVTAVRQLRELLRPYRWTFLGGVILSLFPAFFQILSPYLLGKGIDEGIGQSSLDELWFWGSLFLAAQCLYFLFAAWSQYYLTSFSLHLLVDYRASVLKKVLSYPLSFFDRFSSGRLSTRVTSDINSLQEFFSSALMVVIGNSLLIVGAAVAMLFIHWQLALWCYFCTAILVFIIYQFNSLLRRRFGLERKALSNMNALVGEGLSGLRDLKGLNTLTVFESELGAKSEKYRKRMREAIRVYGMMSPSIIALMQIMSLGILILGAVLMTQETLAIGELVAFLTYAAYFSWPLQELSEKFSICQRALASVDRLVEISNEKPENDHGHRELKNFEKIQFENLSFRYSPEAAWAVENLQFEISRGKKIALIGETGSGKSTTCQLLMRFYEAQKGQIRFDNHTIDEFSLASLRSQISWVSQEVSLFSATLRDNIKFYDERVTDERIWETLELVQLKDWALSLEGGLDHRLEEKAVSLSSGQRQLISIARAIAAPSSLLIMDEATAYVDSQTEFALQEAMERLWSSERMKSTTAIFVAHRLSTIQRCDEILVFRKARVVERGSFDDLMKFNGYAAQLYRHQFREKTQKVK